ncbi:DUF2690 domain-containing protein [Thermoactinospora rubra]|uniref:DUF2690 domain-containing protein n=1 Tax=Thermoactinospora rubra TaxID=1088767 RepID=UPI000A116EA2|nr:DUF2690 domain-containing protein [Thermoactinospora rubra]
MKIGPALAAVAGAASLLLLPAAPAAAHSLDGKDPYRTGCADSKLYTGKSATLRNELGEPLGVLKLYYSTSCGTNWGEVWVSKRATGTITVSRKGKSVSFTFKAGNGGHHWGDMVHAKRICAWAKATVRDGIGRVNHASGITGRACR